MKAPGFDFQCTKLLCIRAVCIILKVNSLHGKSGMSLRFDQTKFDELYKWFNRNIKRISSVFKINLFGLKKFLSKLNRMLRSWGFATVKKGRLRKVIIRCPIRSNPKGRKNMVRFYGAINEHSEYISVSHWS